MSNNKAIQPISFWTPNGAVSVSYLGFKDFSDYHFDNGNGSVYYCLISMVNNGTQTITDENGLETIVTIPDSAAEVYNGKIEIPSNIMAQWGADDQVIFDYVAQQLNLTLV